MDKKRVKRFDLNIKEILEDWGTEHAIRELMANAYDESNYTKTKDPIIGWSAKTKKLIIKDFGRGLKIDNLVQTESKEKDGENNLIGKFGIGLKDAIAVLHRREKKLVIKTDRFNIGFNLYDKSLFKSIPTIHAEIESVKNNLVGTEIHISNINSAEFRDSKNFFIKTQNGIKVDSNEYGEIHKKLNSKGIYINGMLYYQNSDLAYSYNITKVSNRLERSLNRERSSLQKQVYAPSIQKILINTTSNEIIMYFVNLIKDINRVEAKEELNWVDVEAYFIQQNPMQDILVLNKEHYQDPELRFRYSSEQKHVILGRKNLIEKLDNIKSKDGYGYTGKSFLEKLNSNFNKGEISHAKLSEKELESIKKAVDFIKLNFPYLISKYLDWRQIKIATQLEHNITTGSKTLGLFEQLDIFHNVIWIHRDLLKDFNQLKQVLVHEAIHARYEYNDSSREFEMELDKVIHILIKINSKTKSK